MNRTAILCLIACILQPPKSKADYLVAARPARIRAAPNSAATILRDAVMGDQFQLLSNNQSNGYYHVLLPSAASDGWIYRTFVRRYTGTAPVAAVDWGLHIAILSVGQADAICIVSSDGQACVIDAGRSSTAAQKVANFLKRASENAVTMINRAKLGFATHFDADHIGGFKSLVGAGIAFNALYDQGKSLRRANSSPNSVYNEYLRIVGDPNDNMVSDPGETAFIRKKAEVDLQWSLGNAKISCLSVRGDTMGTNWDLDLDVASHSIDENAGSIALLVTLGEFEFYTAGDQSSASWKAGHDTEMGIVNSGVMRPDNDIDVLKVGHHGSDTSSGTNFVQALRPELAVITAEHTDHNLPKMITLKTLVQCQSLVLITGDGRNPETLQYPDSNATTEDDEFVPPGDSVYNDVGDIHIFVAHDGRSYRVLAGTFSRVFSSVDGDNPHP